MYLVGCFWLRAQFYCHLISRVRVMSAIRAAQSQPFRRGSSTTTEPGFAGDSRASKSRHCPSLVGGAFAFTRPRIECQPRVLIITYTVRLDTLTPKSHTNMCARNFYHIIYIHSTKYRIPLTFIDNQRSCL